MEGNTELVFGNVKIFQAGFGLNIEIRYLDDQNLVSRVSCSIKEEFGINYSATGSLDRKGQIAHAHLVAIATALYNSL